MPVHHTPGHPTPIHLVFATPCAGCAAGDIVTDPDMIEHLLEHSPHAVIKLAPLAPAGDASLSEPPTDETAPETVAHKED